ncbi:hypothetical protein CC78DRAFT_231665 [Lojkania enalia]|uniref:G-patch domain-containing protein n=1 Tax=Lojkania enalia TaxID=147567 RepID=A0A9P4K9K6_9PLEO|nr:hypothetical protein CC78DRAFT_231665 [Didymosphaeria enalia]
MNHTHSQHKDYYDDDDISTKPFVEQPTFSRGLGRYPIKFVPAAASIEPPQPAPAPVDGSSFADQYLAIVFPNGKPASPAPEYPICPTCKLIMKEPDARAHHLSVGHQMSLPRAPTPSGIDRTRMGLKYLEKHGFDVDSRKGLGAMGQGRMYPIVPMEKRDTYGLGVEPMKKEEAQKFREIKLNAGQVRKQAALSKKKDEKLRQMFYCDDKINEYLSQLDGHG